MSYSLNGQWINDGASNTSPYGFTATPVNNSNLNPYHNDTVYGGPTAYSAPKGPETTEAIVHTDGGPTTGTKIYSGNAYDQNYLVQPPAPNPALQNLQLPGPNVAQQWFDAHKSLWDQPGAANQYWSTMQNTLAHPGTGEQALLDMLPNYMSPSQGELGVQGLLPQLQGKTAAEQMFDQLQASGAFTRPGAAEDYYQAHKADFEKTGAAEDFYSQYGGRLTRPGELETHMGQLEGQFNSARSAEDFWKNYGMPAVSKEGYTEKLADQWDPNRRTYSEDFLLGGGATAGLDQTYNRLYDVGSRKLDEASAARGGFNSGASLRGNQELMADLDAKHVQDVMLASNQADTQRLAQVGRGTELTSAADAALRGRLQTGFLGSAASDKSIYDRTKGLADLYGNVSGERRENLTAAGGMAKNAQDAMMARLTGGSGVALNSDQAKALRENLGISAAGASTKGFLDRTQTAGNLNKSLSDMLMERLGRYADTSFKAGGLENDRYRTGSQIAQAAGSEDLQRLTGGQAAASAVTTANQQDLRDYWDRVFGLGKAEAGTTADALGAIRADQAAAVTNEINLMLKGGQLDAANSTAATNLAANLIKGGMELSQAVATVKQAYGKAGAGSTGGGSTTNTDKI